MTTNELLLAARDALKADRHLHTWCMETFGRVATIVLGVDAENPPDPVAFCPIVAVVKAEQRRGESRKEIEWLLYLTVEVFNEEIVSDGSTQTFTGLLQAEELRERAENAIYRAGLAGADSDSETASVNLYPLFGAYSVMTFQTPRSTRRRLAG